ncbi:M20 metallopeptidase family protein [Nannocystis pusilla]|uniref:Amidohydrolase n=1 Tax=Nannocystis pusilla TaxID=889268 RepID=A0ABS7TTB7_9BACT|nr:amidohydrolase [Nannocystis pusilla]MBZ5711479.1 amidohydrolase [Nannocystis pusilla]
MSWTDPRAEIAALSERLREIRHDIHRHPELGFEEVRTQALVRAWLEERGYQPRNCAETGLVADLHPNHPGPTIALRADLDCLPMHESTDLPHRSVHQGKAHKCGHDGHTAILLGVADILARHRESVRGNIRLLFQPAEEGVRGGGAKVMIEEGALAGVREIYGLHNWPAYPKGELRVQPGPMLAQVHMLDITIRGKGGHGSQPQLCRDPIVAGAHLIGALQTVVSRGLGYAGGGVVSITQFSAGTTHNVIPDVARMKGTIRTFAPSTTERVLERVREVVSGVAATFAVDIDLQIEIGYPVLMNDARCVEAVVRVGAAVLGAERVSNAELPLAGGEDFAYFAQAVPAAYFFLGARRGDEDTPVCHHPDFDFDDDLIPTGVAMFLGIVRDRLGAPA